MDSEDTEVVSIAEQAAQWLLTMQAPKPADRAAFWTWMDASPLHVREFILAVKTQRRLRGFDRERQFEVDALLEMAHPQLERMSKSNNPAFDFPRPYVPPRTKPRFVARWGYAAAACAALLAIATLAYVALSHSQDAYSTNFGEQLVVALADGSLVSLNTDTRMKVRFSEHARDVYLPKGQALFEVRHDPSRPFRVHAAASVVEAVGTQFDVRIVGDGALVSVLEGAVNVLDSSTEIADASAAPMHVRSRLAAGEAVTVNASGEIESTSKIDVAAVAAWKQQRLIFNDETLGWIVDEFNRYNTALRLKVEGAELRSRRFNGVFHAHSPESLIEYLQYDPTIAFDRRDDEVIIREATQPRLLTTELLRL